MASRSIFAAAFCLAAGGCVSFLPAYDAALFKHLDAVSDDVEKIHAAIEVVHAGPTEFAAVEPYYVDAFAHLRAAKAVAGERSVYSAHKLSAKAASDELRAIDNCEMALTDTLQRLRAGPVNAATERVFADQDVCAIPSTMETLLNRKR